MKEIAAQIRQWWEKNASEHPQEECRAHSDDATMEAVLTLFALYLQGNLSYEAAEASIEILVSDASLCQELKELLAKQRQKWTKA